MSAQMILASASPRRAALLKQLGLRFEVSPQSLDESRRPGEKAGDFVQRLATEKAQAGWRGSERMLPVLGADTVVCVDDRCLGKPADRDHGIAMLQLLSGREHEVLTAVAIVQDAHEETVLSRSRVRFREVGEDEAAAYWASGEPADKAGGYAIQGLGAVFVSTIQGSYSGVVGLPLSETAALLRGFGIDVLGRATFPVEDTETRS